VLGVFGVWFVVAVGVFERSDKVVSRYN